MRFKDRADAGRRLAALLQKYRGKEGVVFALPRGGVPVGAEVARALDMPLDLIIARKIGHPDNPEYAIAAVTETGELAANPQEVEGVNEDWYRRAVVAERQEAQRRHGRYLGDRPGVTAEGRVAIVVDDGIATGLTVTAAIKDARRRKPSRLVLAVPVAPRDTAGRLSRMVDDFVAVGTPEYFLGAVGAYYDDFRQVTDEEVVAILAGTPAAGAVA